MKTVTRKIDTEISFTTIVDQPVCSISITQSSLLEWIAILWMILEEIGSAVIVGKRGSKCLLNLGTKSSLEYNKSVIEVTLNKNDITCVAAYLLRYFRDGFAEVNHLDIEDHKRIGYITFKADNYSPPIPENEARRRLGL